MDSGKVGESSSGDDGIVFACGVRHQLDDECGSNACGARCKRE